VRRDELHPALISHMSKYRSLMPALAVLFELAEWATGNGSADTVSLEHTRQAALYCAYLESQARRVYSCVVTLQQRAAWDTFSMIPGAPSSTAKPAAPAQNGASKPATTPAPAPAPASAPTAAKAEAPKAEPKPEPKGPPIAAKELDGKIVLVFPAERFDLDVAAALGKRDWDQIVRGSDNFTGAVRDKLHRDGASFIAPLEFLSEVFVDGKPLTKQQFERDAKVENGAKSLDVHFPRFGDVVLLEIPGKGRFVTSLTDRAERAVALVS